MSELSLNSHNTKKLDKYKSIHALIYSCFLSWCVFFVQKNLSDNISS